MTGEPAMKWVMPDKRVLDALAAWRDVDSDAWDSGFLGLIGRYLPWFEAKRIEYAFTDTVAVRLHGADPRAMNAALLTTPASWERICQAQGDVFQATRNGDQGNLSVNGSGHGSIVTFHDSLDGFRVCIHGVWVASLPYLIDNYLLRPSESELRKVRGLIRANGLDGAFAKSLSTRSRRTHYLACLAQVWVPTG
jgi:hypothetical protein